MKKYVLTLALCATFSRSFADVIQSQPTGKPSLDYLLIAGVSAVVVLLIVRQVRKRKQL